MGNVFGLNSLQLLQVSALYNLPVVILLSIAGVQDNKKHEVSGYLCLAIGALILIHAVLFSNSVIFILIAGFCFGAVFCSKELDYFGQADFLIIAHYFTSYTFTSVGFIFVALAGGVWLVCLFIFLHFYRDEFGDKWKLGGGILVPAIPSYAASSMVTEVLRILLTSRLFYLGL